MSHICLCLFNSVDNEDGGRTGDLDIAARNNLLTIGTVDGQKATIDASGLLNSDRVFQVLNDGKLLLANAVVTVVLFLSSLKMLLLLCLDSSIISDCQEPEALLNCRSNYIFRSLG